MKQIITLFIAAACFIGLSSFKGNSDGIAPAALQSFQSSFKTATDVNWTVSENGCKASFQMNSQYVTAYYDASGNMIGLTRNLNIGQLPLSLQSSLKKDYDSYWISDLFEVANDEGTCYYITLENGDTRMILKSASGSDWYTFKKQRKA